MFGFLICVCVCVWMWGVSNCGDRDLEDHVDSANKYCFVFAHLYDGSCGLCFVFA